MENLQMLGLAAVVLVAVRFLTALRAQDWDGVLKTLISWAAGIGGVLLYAQTDQADSIQVGDVALSQLGGWDQLLLGLSLASIAGAVHVGYRAIDSSQSARQAKLVKDGVSQSGDDA